MDGRTGTGPLRDDPELLRGDAGFIPLLVIGTRLSVASREFRVLVRKLAMGLRRALIAGMFGRGALFLRAPPVIILRVALGHDALLGPAAGSDIKGCYGGAFFADFT